MSEFTFEHDGKTYALPHLSEKDALNIPGGITEDAIMEPESEMAQMRLALASLEAVQPSDEARRALRSMSTGKMFETVMTWMGESEGSSVLPASTVEPSSTTSAPASDSASGPSAPTP